MALSIQGKHFASKFKLIIDLFPVAQLTSEKESERVSGQTDREKLA